MRAGGLILIKVGGRCSFHHVVLGLLMVDDSGIDLIADGDEDPPPEILDQVPRGALALAGLTVGLLLVCWLAMYLFVFLPRGPIG